MDSIILVPIPGKDTTKKKKYVYIWANIPGEQMHKSLTKYQQTKYSNASKRLYIMIKWDLLWECKVGAIFTNK